MSDWDELFKDFFDADAVGNMTFPTADAASEHDVAGDTTFPTDDDAPEPYSAPTPLLDWLISKGTDDPESAPENPVFEQWNDFEQDALEDSPSERGPKADPEAEAEEALFSSVNDRFVVYSPVEEAEEEALVSEADSPPRSPSPAPCEYAGPVRCAAPTRQAAPPPAPTHDDTIFHSVAETAKLRRRGCCQDQPAPPPPQPPKKSAPAKPRVRAPPKQRRRSPSPVESVGSKRSASDADLDDAARADKRRSPTPDETIVVQPSGRYPAGKYPSGKGLDGKSFSGKSLSGNSSSRAVRGGKRLPGSSTGVKRLSSKRPSLAVPARQQPLSTPDADDDDEEADDKRIESDEEDESDEAFEEPESQEDEEDDGDNEDDWDAEETKCSCQRAPKRAAKAKPATKAKSVSKKKTTTKAKPASSAAIGSNDTVRVDVHATDPEDDGGLTDRSADFDDHILGKRSGGWTWREALITRAAVSDAVRKGWAGQEGKIWRHAEERLRAACPRTTRTKSSLKNKWYRELRSLFRLWERKALAAGEKPVWSSMDRDAKGKVKPGEEAVRPDRRLARKMVRKWRKHTKAGKRPAAGPPA